MREARTALWSTVCASIQATNRAVTRLRDRRRERLARRKCHVGYTASVYSAIAVVTVVMDARVTTIALLYVCVTSRVPCCMLHYGAGCHAMRTSIKCASSLTSSTSSPSAPRRCARNSPNCTERAGSADGHSRSTRLGLTGSEGVWQRFNGGGGAEGAHGAVKTGDAMRAAVAGLEA